MCGLETEISVTAATDKHMENDDKGGLGTQLGGRPHVEGSGFNLHTANYQRSLIHKCA